MTFQKKKIKKKIQPRGYINVCSKRCRVYLQYVWKIWIYDKRVMGTCWILTWHAALSLSLCFIPVSSCYRWPIWVWQGYIVSVPRSMFLQAGKVVRWSSLCKYVLFCQSRSINWGCKYVNVLACCWKSLARFLMQYWLQMTKHNFKGLFLDHKLGHLKCFQDLGLTLF